MPTPESQNRATCDRRDTSTSRDLRAAQQQSFFEAVGGHETFDKIVHGFYVRMRQDDLIGPMYPDDDWDGAEDRLRMFLEQYWGGPHDYNEQRGHPRLRMRHMPFSIGEAERDRWLELMAESMAEVSDEELPPNYRAAMWRHMEQVANMLINRMD